MGEGNNQSENFVTFYLFIYYKNLALSQNTVKEDPCILNPTPQIEQ